MKSKKGQEQIITTILIILLVMAAIVMVWQAIRDTWNPTEEFVIYEEICEVDLSTESYYSECVSMCWYGISHILNMIGTDLTQEQIVYAEDLCISGGLEYCPPKQSCEKVEVDEIELFPYSNCATNKFYFSEEEIYKSWIDKDNITNYCIIEYNKISKQDLTKELLDENCEIATKCDASGENCKYGKKEGFYIGGKLNYKCEDYYVKEI